MITKRRQKGFLTIILLSSCLIYLNWLVNINDWVILTNKTKQTLTRNIDKLKKESIQINELVEKYGENININFKNQIMLMAVRDVSSQETYNDLNDNYLNVKNNDFSIRADLSRADLSLMFNILYKHKAFLVDTKLLNELKEAEVELLPNLKNKITNFKRIEQFFDKSLKSEDESILIAFGIYLDSFEILNKNLVESFSKKCQFKLGSYVSDNKKLVSNMYIECKSVIIQISIFYERNNFLWIGDDQHVIPNKKIFGDTPRAINKFILNQVQDDDKNQFFLPADIQKYLFDYGHSKFLECNRELADKNLKLLGVKYQQNAKRNKMILPVVQHLTSTLESYEKHYWLAGGTLLGWYRDCGIIPHTQDVDLAIWAHEYDDRIKEHFLGNKIVRVWGTLGLLNDSFEFRLYNDQFTFDMFLVYNINTTHQWCGYQVNRVKFRRLLPNFNELCSAELLNQKLMIPCDPVKYLDNEYGVNNWATPLSKNYQWKNVIYYKNWTNNEWPHAVRYYDKEGKLLEKKTLDYINQHLKVKIESLPKTDLF